MTERANFFTTTADGRLGVLYDFAASRGALPRRDAVPHAGAVDQVWEALAQAGVASPGLAFADWVEFESLGGVVPALLVNCPDVAAFLTQLGHYHALIGRSHLGVTVGPKGAVVEVSEDDGSPSHPDLVDACFALLVRTLTRLVGLREVPARVELRRWRPIDSGVYESRFRVVKFGAERDCCRLGPEVLGLALVRADPALFGLLKPYADVQLAAPQRSWSQAVVEVLQGQLMDRPSLAEVARALAVSPRSLQGYLQDEGTSFTEILDEVRRQQVMSLLTVKGMLLVDIADQVGLGSQASLARAIRRWTGQTATQLRDESS